MKRFLTRQPQNTDCCDASSACCLSNWSWMRCQGLRWGASALLEKAEFFQRNCQSICHWNSLHSHFPLSNALNGNAVALLNSLYWLFLQFFLVWNVFKQRGTESYHFDVGYMCDTTYDTWQMGQLVLYTRHMCYFKSYGHIANVKEVTVYFKPLSARSGDGIWKI